MPLVAISESVREVLPWSTCARMQMLRMLAGVCWRVTSVVGAIEGIFAVDNTRGTGGVWDLLVWVLTMIAGPTSLMVSERERELFLRQSQGRRVQPVSWRCAGGGRCGALGRQSLAI